MFRPYFAYDFTDTNAKKYEVRDVTSSMIGDCVYKICQKLERQPPHKTILEMMPEVFKPN